MWSFTHVRIPCSHSLIVHTHQHTHTNTHIHTHTHTHTDSHKSWRTREVAQMVQWGRLNRQIPEAEVGLCLRLSVCVCVCVCAH